MLPSPPSSVHHGITSYSSADNASADDDMLMRLISPTDLEQFSLLYVSQAARSAVENKMRTSGMLFTLKG